jgi:hypothetical protein
MLEVKVRKKEPMSEISVMSANETDKDRTLSERIDAEKIIVTYRGLINRERDRRMSSAMAAVGYSYWATVWCNGQRDVVFLPKALFDETLWVQALPSGPVADSPSQRTESNHNLNA